MSLRFMKNNCGIRVATPSASGGIRPEKGDHIVAIAIVDPDAMLLVAGENGIGKRTPFDDYRGNRGAAKASSR